MGRSSNVLLAILIWLRDRLGDVTMWVAWQVERIERARGCRNG